MKMDTTININEGITIPLKKPETIKITISISAAKNKYPDFGENSFSMMLILN